MKSLCGWCGKPCTEIAGRTSCCRSPNAFCISGPKLTWAQIEAMAAKLDANGLKAGARVFDVNDGPYEDEHE